MGYWESRLNNEVDPLVPVAEFNHRIISLKVSCIVEDLGQCRVCPVHQHTGAVEHPLEQTSCVLANCSRLKIIPVGIFNCLGYVRYNIIRLVIATVGVVVGSSGWRAGAVSIVDDALDVIGGVVIGTGGLWDGAHPEVVGNVGLICSDYDIVALAYKG